MEKTLRVLNELERDGVIGRYAVGGAVAAVFYMEPFLTYDLDVFVILPAGTGGPLTLAPLNEALRTRGYREQGETVLIEGTPVQFLAVPNALAEEALNEALEKTVGEVQTRVFRPEHLMAIMLQTGREKDRLRFAAFEREAPIDQDRLLTILQRHDLERKRAQWKA